MIRTAAQLAALPEGSHKHVTIRGALPGDVAFLDHLQKTYRKQLGFLPRVALEGHVERGRVSIAFENGEPAAYLLGKGNYLRDPHFAVVYQAAVSYDARRRLLGTALVQHFIDHLPGATRLVGLWCAQDIEANEFWSACGFEAVAARHGSKSRGRVHIFWVGRTARGRNEPIRIPRFTRGGLMREQREVYALEPGDAYREVVLPERGPRKGPHPQPLSQPRNGERGDAEGSRAGRPRHPERGGSETCPTGETCSTGEGRPTKATLAEMQRAFRYGGETTKHVCVVIAGVTRYLPVAPFDMPEFADVGRVMRAAA